MKAIIIAAGSGKRLGELTKNLPKGLLDVSGKSIIQRQIELLQKNGITNIIVITGINPENFYFKDVKYIHDDEYEDHDILCSLMAARQEIKDDVLIFYSDIVFEEKILQQILNKNVDIGIAIDMQWKKSYIGRTEHPMTEAENVVIDNEKITEIRKNITDKQNVGEFLGILKLSAIGSKVFINKFNEAEKKYVDNFHEAQSFKKAYLTDMIQELIDSNHTISPIMVSGRWCEIDTKQDLEIARKKF